MNHPNAELAYHCRYVTSTIIYEVTDVPLQLFDSILEYHTFDDDDFKI